MHSALQFAFQLLQGIIQHVRLRIGVLELQFGKVNQIAFDSTDASLFE